MSSRRVFLDWDRPGLPAAADWLVERFGRPGTLDLGGAIVVVPGGRAGRRLLEILVERSDQSNEALVPPEIVTIGRLPEKLYVAKRPYAGDLVQHLAWVEALRRTPPERLRHVIPSPPDPDDLAAWLSLAEMLARLHRELAAEVLEFASVVDCGPKIERFRETERWQSLAEIRASYLAVLDTLELWDIQTARTFAIHNAECTTDAEIILIGTADMNRAQQEMLSQVREHVTALVVAPESLAERFDEFGCLRAEAWQTHTIDLDDRQIEVVDDPAAQAAAAARAIVAWDGRYAGEEITIGVPDAEVIPFIEQTLEPCGVPIRYGIGTPAGRIRGAAGDLYQNSAPCRVLAASADYMGGRRFAAFAALVRDPSVERWLLGQGMPDDWLIELDNYYNDHMPCDVHGVWLGRGDRCRSLGRVHRALENLLRPMARRAARLDEWGEAIVDLLVNVFGNRSLDKAVDADRAVIQSCQSIQEVLEEYRAVPVSLMPIVSGSEALRLVLRHVGGAAIPSPARRGAVELLGWLELALDDAPALAVTGMNDGVVPSSLNADLFLPNQVRLALGIEDNQRRYARDAYALSVLAASRRELKLIAGRRTAEGNPLVPSRLLFACDEETIARRVRALLGTEESDNKMSAPGALFPGRAKAAFEVPRPRRLAERVTVMSVTEFRDYLACPYRYYLRRRLGLAAMSDASEELDGAAFGSLAHEALKQFGVSPAKDSIDPAEVFEELAVGLDRAVRARYGEKPLSAIAVQVEQLRWRLRELAQWQARRVADGWRIVHVEKSPEDRTAFLTVDGEPMYLRGRIDRIDYCEATGRYAILDYKTSDTAKSPDQVHREAGRWVDLQLPLYRHLAAGLGITGPIDLGYLVLPKDISRIGWLAAEWTDEEFCDADRAAEEVVRAVRQERFWPPVSPPPAFFDDLAAICQDDQFGASLASADEGAGP
jgi:ATP-dependent helicase/nuclease subunit B